MRRRRLLAWGLPGLLYAAFLAWYTDFGGPLREAEIASYLERLEALGASAQRLEEFRRFMERDTGLPFLMLNAIDFADDPPDVPGAEPGESASQLMSRYMEHLLPELLWRACHPVVVGEAAHAALDLAGVDALEGAERWDLGGLVRYRSRRSFLEIVTIPETLERHAFKRAALDKTIAFPIETRLDLGDPRVTLGLVLLCAALLTDRRAGRPLRAASPPPEGRNHRSTRP